MLDAFDPRGVYRGALRTPGLDRLEIHVATDGALYGVQRGELDEPRVVRLRLLR